MSPIESSEPSNREENPVIEIIGQPAEPPPPSPPPRRRRPNFNRIIVEPAEQLVENLERIIRRMTGPGALINVEMDTLAFRLRQINRTITQLNIATESLLAEDWMDLSMSPAETERSLAESRRQTIMEILGPYVLAMDTLMRINNRESVSPEDLASLSPEQVDFNTLTDMMAANPAVNPEISR